MAGEFDFIEWVRGQQKASALIQLAAGDDMAVMKWPADDLLLVGVDQVLDGVHFDSAVHAPRLIGRKVMNRNLSDCAAMGCWPATAVATVALPASSGMEYAKELYRGLRDAADPFGCEIVGGDTGSWSGKLVVTVTILGQSSGIKPVTRGGARPGDAIYVTGPLGGSILGRHMTFTPRVLLGRSLAGTGTASAMIDLSDGLSRDLPHICRESNVAAVVEAVLVPVHEDAIEMRRDGHSPLEHALHDGEDYELLFTSADQSLSFPPCQRIGRIITGQGVWIETATQCEPLEPKGWEHTL
jgi:thiamine-monophosphate kinase